MTHNIPVYVVLAHPPDTTSRIVGVANTREDAEEYADGHLFPTEIERREMTVDPDIEEAIAEEVCERREEVRHR